MLKITNLSVKLTEGNQILHDLNLKILPGQVHLLNGKNGSGKSTLVNTLMGNPNFKISNGEFSLENHVISDYIATQIESENIKKVKEGKFNIKLSELEINERALVGLFLANQYPTEIPGVSLASFLRLIFNSRRLKEDQLPVFKFRKLLEQKAAIINYPSHLLKRNLNEGFSGGEKKKTEILQMLLLEPSYVFLDEIDSGLDKASVKEVFTGLAVFKEISPNTSFVIITHYEKVKEYLKIDVEHEMFEGKLV